LHEEAHRLFDDLGALDTGDLACEHLLHLLEMIRRRDGDVRVGAGRALEGLGSVEREQLPVVDDREPVTEEVGLLHVVGREEDGLAVTMKLTEHIPERDAALGVETRGRFVEEADRRLVHDRPGDHEPLCHPTRELEHGNLRAVGETELLEQAVGLVARSARRHPEEAAVEVEVLPDVQRPVERVRLRDDTEHLLRGDRVLHHVDAGDERASFRRDDAGREHPGGGRLARTVGTEEPEDLAGVHRQVELVDGLDPARVDLRQTLGPDDLVGVHAHQSRRLTEPRSPAMVRPAPSSARRAGCGRRACPRSRRAGSG
jgi:hypothetical protein